VESKSFFGAPPQWAAGADASTRAGSCLGRCLRRRLSQPSHVRNLAFWLKLRQPSLNLNVNFLPCSTRRNLRTRLLGGIRDMIVPRTMRLGCILALGLLGQSLSSSLLAADAETTRPDAREVARRVDRILTGAMDKTASLPPLTDDETFLRRACLDLTGQLPSPEEVRAFVADTDPKKRAKQIDRLLQTEAYASNWGRYWRDVLTYYTPASGNYLRWQLWSNWWVEQVRRNRSWGDIVTALVTATGINDEVAPVNFLT